MAQRKLLVLVDGSSYLYRAYHAMPNLTNSSGAATGAVYGITNMLRRLLSDYATPYIAVVFDAKGKTFRNDLYPDYKANRPPMPDELRTQIDAVHEIVEAMGFPKLVVSGVEADDVIGTLATRATEQGFDTIISTGDKDMAQLVDDHVQIVDTMKDVIYDTDGVQNKFGVPPASIVDYLTLTGDASDNIPGVPKVGPKTAAKWIQKYGSLDAIVAHVDEIGGKVGENLRASVDQLPVSKRLVTIKRDVELESSPVTLMMREPDEACLRELYARLEFRAWLAELGGLDSAQGASAADATDFSVEYDMVTDADALEGWIERLGKAECFAFDTETTSLDPLSAELVGVSFADAVGRAAYVPVAHCYDGAPPQLERAAVLAALKPLLEDPAVPKIGQNLKYDAAVLANYDVTLQGIRYDTMLESYVLDSTASRHDMDSLAIKYLGYKTIKFEEVAGKGKAQVTFDQVALDVASNYAAEDADVTLRLHQTLWPKLEDEPTLQRLFETVEMPLVPVLGRIERNGVKVDAEMLGRQSAELAKRAAELEAEAHTAAGCEFNIASPKQIQEILYDKLGLPVLRKTPKGQPSTAENVLQELAVDFDLPRLILEHRGLAKLKSTYTDKLPDLINPRTGRIHTSYHQAVAATGRLSSADPNLQNIPVRSAEGRRIREAFIPEPGYRLVSADYSQIELRIMAHLSGDKGLLAAFAQGADVHRATAAEVFAVAADAVSDDQRRHAKAINFGLIYGMSAFGLAQQLRIDRAQAQDYIDLYFARYPGVKAFMDNTRAVAHERGYVETVYGRRLYLPEIDSRNYNRRQYAERTAINAPMQGTAADLIKLAMLAVDRWITDSKVDVRVILQVHDELVVEVVEDIAADVAANLAELMSGVAELAVPLEVDSGIGANWAEAHR
ncbi:MAG: DNA polymerase I [Gammaproteobacteria bacterium]|nr:DNA polymerase I [Gammaproteobacteria bacterium]MDH3466735.1 DNA polymerase I [Gammaproteobacteria bacterium]